MSRRFSAELAPAELVPAAEPAELCAEQLADRERAAVLLLFSAECDCPDVFAEHGRAIDVAPQLGRFGEQAADLVRMRIVHLHFQLSLHRLPVTFGDLRSTGLTALDLHNNGARCMTAGC